MREISRSKLKYLLLILLILFVWIYFPFIFMNLMNWMGWIGPDLKGYSEFGAIGDIYGSLNTLISSLALCAVAYSTVLQVNELKLARKTYVDQLNEAKYSNFSALFYSLLQNKLQIFNNLKAESRSGEILIGQHLFAALTTDFFYHLKQEIYIKGEDLQSYEKYHVQKFFSVQLMTDYKGVVFSELLTYFASYSNILNLINNADIKEEQKAFCIRILRDGMTIYEQTILIAISSFDENLKDSFKNSKIIKTSFKKPMILFIKKFHEPDMFENDNLFV